MVTALPTIAWDEGLDAQQDAALARATIEALVAGLREPESSQRRAYVVVPTPAPDPREQTRWMATAAHHGLAAGSLRLVSLSQGGCCFVVEDRAAVERWLPIVFRHGPPEITLLALNSVDHIGSQQVQAVLRDQSHLNPADRAGLHFDSGDLIERF
jgi:hypothetical protein